VVLSDGSRLFGCVIQSRRLVRDFVTPAYVCAVRKREFDFCVHLVFGFVLRDCDIAGTYTEMAGKVCDVRLGMVVERG
jgi:hypothetical protein